MSTPNKNPSANKNQENIILCSSPSPSCVLSFTGPRDDIPNHGYPAPKSRYEALNARVPSGRLVIY